MKALFGGIAAVLGGGGALILYLGLAAGWLYWIYVGVKLGSFMMVIFALLGPLGGIAALLGFWSLLFGWPMWLLHMVS
jgi:hypothetical protein